MFNINAIIKMINTNNDAYIQKEEAEKFTQISTSIFNEYLASINDNVSLDDFGTHLCEIEEIYCENNTQAPEIKFIDKNSEEEYEQYCLDDINEIRNYIYSRYGYKAEDKEAFNQLFSDLLKESVKEGSMYKIYEKFENLELTQPISMQYLQENNLFDISLPIDIALPENIDWSNSREIFDYLSFGEKTFSNTPKEHLPKGYDPQQVFNNGKSIGLGIDEVHGMGYTGEGVSYAIIDSGVAEHNDIKFKEYHISPYSRENLNEMHGSAVSYIAQEIAPNADCYYYAKHSDGDQNAPVLDNLKQILERNKTLPDNQKIRFVSMSMRLYGGEEAKEIVKELESQGVWVFYSGCPEDNQFGYLGKKDPTVDSNDFDNYQIESGSVINIFPDGTEEEYLRENALYVNSGNRTVPDPSSPTAYRHDARASQSWSIPVLAGYYTLACQADPNMTKEKFLRLADETAQIKQSTMPIIKFTDSLNGDGGKNIGRTEKTVIIKIIDIKALLQAIEDEKLNK